MNKTVLRLLSAVTLIGVLSTSVAVPAKCANYVNQTPALIVNDGTMLSVDIGNEIPKKVKIGGQVLSVQSVYYCDHYEHCHNYFYYGCNQYLATNTNATGSELPYSKFSTAGPVVRSVLTNAANSMGFIPGDAFEIEIGKFTNYNGYNPCSSLTIPMNYEIYYYQPQGYIPAMLALLPNGAVTLLDDTMFDRSTQNMWFVDGSHMFHLHTMYPKAVYMMVFMPAK